MNLESAVSAARRGELYPAVILYGGAGEARRAAAIELARTLLCEAPPAERPCGVCRHCRRFAWPEAGAGRDREASAPFHPDVQLLERDLKASTSVDAARELMRGAQVSPFEARGQVFIVASAESLTGEAANALLKNLEEPHLTAPRHFLLLAPSQLDLLATLRSRSLSVYLGPAEAADGERIAAVGLAFGAAAGAFLSTGAAVHLLTAADALAAAGGKRAAGSGSGGDAAAGWEDPRSGVPWAVAAAAVLRALPESVAGSRAARPALLALAEALLSGPAMRMRGVAPERILEGLVARHLAPVGPRRAPRSGAAPPSPPSPRTGFARPGGGPARGSAGR